jgi:hypothetical protein
VRSSDLVIVRKNSKKFIAPNFSWPVFWIREEVGVAIQGQVVQVPVVWEERVSVQPWQWGLGPVELVYGLAGPAHGAASSKSRSWERTAEAFAVSSGIQWLPMEGCAPPPEHGPSHQ